MFDDMQVLGLRSASNKIWARPEAQAQLAAITASCPGAGGSGPLVLTAATDVLQPFDEEDTQLRRYVPSSFGRMRSSL